MSRRAIDIGGSTRLDLGESEPLDIGESVAIDIGSSQKILDPSWHPVTADEMAWQQAAENQPGRARTATSSLVRGFGSMVSGAPKSLALLRGPDPEIWRNLDRIDRGEPYVSLERPIGPGGYIPKPSVHQPLYERYQQGTPQLRQAIRQQFIEQADRIRESALYEAGVEVDKFIAENFPVNPEYQEEFWTSKVPQALGSGLGFVTATIIGRGAFRGTAMGTYGTPTALGSAINAVDQFEQALNEGADIATAMEASQLGAIIGTSEAIPIANLFNRLDRVSGGAVKRYLARALQQGTEEAIQESFSGIMNAAVAAKLYDPERGIWTGERLEEGAVGFTTGVLLETLFTLALPGRRRGQVTGDPAQDTASVEEVEQFAAGRLQELADKADLELTPSERAERDFLAENRNNPRAVAASYGVRLEPVIGERADAATQVEELTDDDRASPIPDELIAEGRAIVDDALGAERADRILEEAGFPTIGSQVTVQARDGGSRTGTVIDAFEDEGTPGAKLQFDDGEVVAASVPAWRRRIVEVTDAEEIRSDEGQVQGRGDERQRREVEGRGDLQQPAQARPETRDRQEEAPRPEGEARPAPVLDTRGLSELRPEPVDEASASPILPPGDRWTGDRGAIPGEPFAFLDGDEETGAAAAALFEIEADGGRVTYEVRIVDGPVFAGSNVDELARRAEAYIDRQEGIEGEITTLPDDIRDRAAYIEGYRAGRAGDTTSSSEAADYWRGVLAGAEESGISSAVRAAERFIEKAARPPESPQEARRPAPEQPAGKRPIARQPSEGAAEAAETDEWRQIGRNAAGKMLYEDARGVRSYLDRGVRITESVQIIPGREGASVSVDVSRRPKEYQTAEEAPSVLAVEKKIGKQEAEDGLETAPAEQAASAPRETEAQTQEAEAAAEAEAIDDGLLVDAKGDINFVIDEEAFNRIYDEWETLFEDPPKGEPTIEKRAKDSGEVLTVEEAQARVDQWRADAIAQGKNPENWQRTILSLFDRTGNWAKPYAEAGYNVILFDIQSGDDVMDFSVEYFNDNVADFGEVYGILAACPCTDFASSGARWFREKDADGRTEASIELVEQTLRTIEYFRPKFWVLENPVGRIERLTSLPKWRTAFQPHNFGDPYTKKTLLWGKFNANLPLANVEPTEGSKMHLLPPSADRGDLRSETPEGFAYAFFKANNFADADPVERTVADYPEAEGAIREGFRAGLSEERIRQIAYETYENLEPEKTIAQIREAIESLTSRQAPSADVTPLDQNLTAIEKAQAMHELGREVEDSVKKALARVDQELGFSSETNFKKLDSIVAKSQRPTFRRKYPDAGVEHVHDSFRFRSVYQTSDVAKIAQAIDIVVEETGATVLKVDLPKMRGDNPWGWRVLPVDLRMPNGLIVEYYFALEKLHEAQEATGHELFEKWRDEDVDSLPNMKKLQAQRDMRLSKQAYDEAWESAAASAGLNADELMASFTSLEDSLSSVISAQSLRRSPSVTEPQEDSGIQSPPSRTREGPPPGGQRTSTTAVSGSLNTDVFTGESVPSAEPAAPQNVTIEPSQEEDRGVQGTVPPGDAGASAEDVQPAPPQRGADRARGQEVGGGAPDVRRTDGGRAEAAGRVPEGPVGEGGRGEDTRDADRVPERERAEGPAREAARVKGLNYRIEPGSLAEDRGRVQKARDNIRAIELMREIEAEGRPATAEEQAELARYVGWGGLKGAFPDASGQFEKGFEKVGNRLRELLSDIEYNTARRSLQYAHYTSEDVVNAMWSAVERMGFEGGKVFEPGMGVGNFAGLMPADLAEHTDYSGLELDHTTARIARLLYPEWGVRQDDYTRAPVPKDTFDLVIGNPPFADVPIKSDPAYPQNFLLHDYFFAKSLDAVRPGGLLAFISSAGTMNKQDTKAREYLADRADLVGAVRLPGMAFKQTANTEVTTDILFFRKRLPDERAEASRQWVETVETQLPDKEGNPRKGLVNRYFAENPEFVLGEEGFFDKLYLGRYAVRAPKGFDLQSALQAAVSRLPESVVTEWADQADRAEIDFGTAERKEGSYYLGRDGALMQQQDGVGRPVQRRGKGVKGGVTLAGFERIKALIPIRDALRSVYAADLAGDTKNADAARKRLNESYDAFVKRFGPINKVNFQYRRPTIIQQESARLAAREEARYIGQPWREGSFDPTPMLQDGATTTAIAQARKAMRESMGDKFDEGSFDPADMPDIVIEKRPNIDPFMDDPESYRLRAIEKHNDSTGEASKTAVFTENVISREKEPEIKSVNDALLYVLNKKGRLDIEAVAQAADVSESKAIEELGNAIFRVPGTENEWVLRDEYLSGNVRRKLRVARAAAERDPSLQRNVESLEAAQPAPLPPSEIAANLGMPWLPTDVIEQFGRDSLGLQEVNVRYIPKMAQWSVHGDEGSAAATSTWGTDNKNAIQLLSDALNRQDPRVYREYDDGGVRRRELDRVATEAAQDKLQQIKERFSEWVWSDPKRSEELAQIYNEEFNSLRVPEPDGSYLTTPGVISSWQWRPHQSRVIARIILYGNTYMAHAVGSGKTSAMIGAGMEMRRLGLVKKPMYAVPNHMLGQFTKEFYQQYPTARIMVADERRFHTSRRKQFIANAANEDVDAIIITHSAFGMIPVSHEFQDGLIQEQIADYREVLEDLGQDDDTRITRGRIERQIERMEQRLSGAANKRADQVFTFEEMGVDFLFVDEAHLFRKLDFATKMSNVKGISPDGSKASWDLYVKTRYLETINPRRNLVLASGTPVTNTMAELYTVSRYLQPHELEERGLSHFDAWAGAFGDTHGELEPNAAGGLSPVVRFSRFVNVPELSTMVRQNMDIVTNADLDQYVTRPKLKGGERVLNLAEKSEDLANYQKALGARLEAIAQRRGPPQPGDDIVLSVINDGRHASIDMRLVDNNAPNDPGSKLNLLVDNVYRIWKETRRQPFHAVKGGEYSKEPVDKGPASQLVFANLGLSGVRGFAVPEYIRAELVRRGVPKNEIAFIADYKTHVAKQRLFNDVVEGKVRVMIGSTAKMATGVNVQRRLYAVHNLDPLWYPADDEQRNGRLLRQGNMNPEVEVHDYSTKGTYDEAMWRMMARKARFIEAFFRGDPELRDMDDLGEASVYEQAAALASADPRLIELAELKEKLEKARRRKIAHERADYSARQKVSDGKHSIAYSTERLKHIRKDIERRVDTSGDNFRATLFGTEYTSRVDAGDRLLAERDLMMEESRKYADRVVGSIGGHDITVEARGQGNNRVVEFYIRRENDYTDHILLSGSAVGTIRSAENILGGFEGNLTYAQQRIDEAKAQVEQFTPQIGRPFTGQEEIDQLQERVRQLERELTASAQEVRRTGSVLRRRYGRSRLARRWLPPEDEGALSIAKPWYFSALARAARNLPQAKGTPQQMMAMLRKQPGVKAEEILWTGIEEFLKGYADEVSNSITKEQIANYLDGNGVELNEVTLADDRFVEERLNRLLEPHGYRADAEYEDVFFYRIGAESSDEVLFFDDLPDDIQDLVNEDANAIPDARYQKYTLPGGRNYREVLLKLPDDALPMAFDDPHFPERNVIAHMRLTDRRGRSGERVLFVEEIQGALHQAGKQKGYIEASDAAEMIAVKKQIDDQRKEIYELIESLDVGVSLNAVLSSIRSPQRQRKIIEEKEPNWKKFWQLPESEARRLQAYGALLDRYDRLADKNKDKPYPAPFRGNAWVELAIKRVIREAAEGNYDTIAWTTGDQQVERFDLSKSVERIEYEKRGDNYELLVVEIGGTPLLNRNDVKPKELRGIVGKEIEQRILNNEGIWAAVRNRMVLRDDNLRVGGESLRSFYDATLPNLFRKAVNKLDRSVSVSEFQLEGGDIEIRVFQGENGRWGIEEGFVFEADGQKGWRREPGYGVFSTKAQAAERLRQIRDRRKAENQVIAIPVTEGMKEAALAGLPLFAQIRPEALENADRLEADLKKRLSEMGIQDEVGVKLVDQIRRMSDESVMTGVEGRYLARMIEVAMGSRDRMWVMDHEVIHAMRDLGLFRSAEWTALSRAAQDRMPEIRERYKGRSLTEEQLVEEAIADMHADWSTGQRQAKGFLRTAFQRIRDFLEALGNALRGLGFQSAGDIFRRMSRGEMGRRRGWPGEEPRDAAGVQYSRASSQNQGKFNGKRFWSGLFDPLDGFIEHVYTYEQAEGADFHHSIYMTPEQADKVSSGDAVFFWIDRGDIRTTWANQGPIEPRILAKVRKQIEFDEPRYALRPGDFDPKKAREAVKFDNEESESRWQEARKGLRGGETLISQVSEYFDRMGRGFARHFIHLPNEPRFSEAREKLRKIEAAPQASKEEALRILRRIVDGMDQRELDLFTRKVVLEDLSFEVDQQHQLPFGMTPADVERELAKVNAALPRHLHQRVQLRNRLVKRVAEELVRSGVLTRQQIANPAYYRHQVLEYARAQVQYARTPGKKLRAPHWARRMGSRLDINANLLEAEFEWLQKALTDVAVADTIEWFRRSDYNIRDRVIASARARNQQLVDRILAKDLLDHGYFVREDRQTGEQIFSSPLNDQWKGFAQRIAIGLRRVRASLADVQDIPPEFDSVVESLLNEEQSETSIFPFLSWIIDNEQPGSVPAASTFKAINQRKAWVKALLGDKYADPLNIDLLIKRGFAPEGYVTWQPDEGRLLFTAKTISEHALDRMLDAVAEAGAGPVSAEEMRAALESVRSLLAVGGPKYQMVLPEEVADTLNSIKDEHHDSVIEALFSVPMAFWKRWVLINPRRVLKYNLNNLSGDLDAVIAGDPRALKKLPQAIRELWQVMIKGKTPSARYREAVDRGVFDSGLTIQEIPDINYMQEFEQLVNPPSPLRQPVRFTGSQLMRVWRALQRYTWFRENWLRYAAYLDYVERLEAGEDMRSIGYGAAKREMVQAVEDPKDRAALLARELVGDYGAISHFGKGLRRKVIPFYSWMEINTKRYWRLGINAWDQGIGQGFRTAGIVGASIGVRTTAWLALRAALLYGAVQLWNNLVMGDEEEELSTEDRIRLHLTLGRTEDGEIVVLRFQGALSDFLGWIGFADAVAVSTEIEKGRAGWDELLKTIAKAPVNRVLNGLTPVISAPVEMLSGKQFWPDVFRPRVIRDRWREFASLMSVEHEYDLIFDRPSRGYASSLAQTVVYKRDVAQNAYNRIKGMTYDYLRREKGLQGSGGYVTPRSQALYEWRLAKKFGDTSAERKAYEKLRELGVSGSDLRASVRRAHPLGSLPVRDRAAFLRTLTSREKKMLDQALRWYEETYVD